MRCEAILYCRQGRADPRCGEEGKYTIGNHAFCWMHRLILDERRATVAQLLAGERSPNPYDPAQQLKVKDK